MPDSSKRAVNTTEFYNINAVLNSPPRFPTSISTSPFSLDLDWSSFQSYLLFSPLFTPPTSSYSTDLTRLLCCLKIPPGTLWSFYTADPLLIPPGLAGSAPAHSARFICIFSFFFIINFKIYPHLHTYS